MPFEYPAKFEPQPVAGFVVTFPDIREAITQGETPDEVMDMASDALETALSFYVEAWEALPEASVAKQGQMVVRPSALGVAKLLVFQAMHANGISKTQLALRLRVRQIHVDQILNLCHPSRLDQIEAAAYAVGIRLAVDAEAAVAMQTGT